MNDSRPPDPYQALGLDKNATPAAIKTAYRKAALKCHPDKTNDQTKVEEFHAIQQAYDILGDDEKRKHYDNTVRLFDLKRELHQARGGFPASSQQRSPRPNSYAFETRTPSGAQTTTGWSSRGPSVFQERRPKDFPEPTPSAKETSRDGYFDRSAEHASARKFDSAFEPSPRKSAPSSSSKSAAKAESIRSTKAETTKSRSDTKKQRDREMNRDRQSKYAAADDSYSSDDSAVPRSRPRGSSTRQQPKEYEQRRSRDPRASRESQRDSRQSDSESFDNDRTRKYRHLAEEFTRHTGMSAAFFTSSSSRRTRSPPSAYKEPEVPEGRRSSTGNVRPGLLRRSSSTSKSHSKDARPAPASRRTSHAGAESERAVPSFAHSRSSPADIRIPTETARDRSDDRYDAPPRLNRSSTTPLEREAERSRSGPQRTDSTPLPDTRSRVDRPAPRSRRSDAQPSVSSGLRHHAETQDSGYSTTSPNEPAAPGLPGAKAYGTRSGSDEYIPTTIREPTKGRRSESPVKDPSRFTGSSRRDEPYNASKYVPNVDRERGPPPSRWAYTNESNSTRRPQLSRANSHSSRAVPTVHRASSSRASPREPELPKFHTMLFGEVPTSRSPESLSPVSPNASRERFARYDSESAARRSRTLDRDGPPSTARREVPLMGVNFTQRYDDNDVRYASGNVGSSGGLGRRNSISGHQAVYNTVEPRPSRRSSANTKGNARAFMVPPRNETYVC